MAPHGASSTHTTNPITSFCTLPCMCVVIATAMRVALLLHADATLLPLPSSEAEGPR
jgi:hypothetical protein